MQVAPGGHFASVMCQHDPSLRRSTRPPGGAWGRLGSADAVGVTRTAVTAIAGDVAEAAGPAEALAAGGSDGGGDAAEGAPVSVGCGAVECAVTWLPACDGVCTTLVSLAAGAWLMTQAGSSEMVVTNGVAILRR